MMSCNEMNIFDCDAEILFSVGRRFLTGNGVEKDLEKAHEMLSQAASMGHELAARLLTEVAEEHKAAIGNTSKNVIILVGSPRKGGNTDLLAKAFCDGLAKRHNVEIVYVSDYHVVPCLGCNSCFNSKSYECCHKDDMNVLYDKLNNADVLIIATPVYFYGISAQLKTVIDRLHNPIRDNFHIKQAALLAVGAASLPELFDAIITEYKLCLNFFHIENIGMVLVRSVKEKGDIINTNALAEAKNLGETV